jgi:hypothetical protein
VKENPEELTGVKSPEGMERPLICLVSCRCFPNEVVLAGQLSFIFAI